MIYFKINFISSFLTICITVKYACAGIDFSTCQKDLKNAGFKDATSGINNYITYYENYATKFPKKEKMFILINKFEIEDCMCSPRDNKVVTNEYCLYIKNSTGESTYLDYSTNGLHWCLFQDIEEFKRNVNNYKKYKELKAIQTFQISPESPKALKSKEGLVFNKRLVDEQAKNLSPEELMPIFDKSIENLASKEEFVGEPIKNSASNEEFVDGTEMNNNENMNSIPENIEDLKFKAAINKWDNKYKICSKHVKDDEMIKYRGLENYVKAMIKKKINPQHTFNETMITYISFLAEAVKTHYDYFLGTQHWCCARELKDIGFDPSSYQNNYNLVLKKWGGNCESIEGSSTVKKFCKYAVEMKDKQTEKKKTILVVWCKENSDV